MTVEDIELRWAYSHEESKPIIGPELFTPVSWKSKPVFALEFRLKIDGEWREWVWVPHEKLPPHRHTL